MSDTCTYEEAQRTGYYTDWKTACGEDVRCDVPEEVGICFAPKPNEHGKYCHFCGKLIVLKEK